MRKNSFLEVQQWIPHILQVIKKEIRKEGKALGAKLKMGSFEEIAALYEKELLAGNEDLADWVVHSWVFKHGDVYQYFADRLAAINPNFTELEALTEMEADQVLAGSVERFGATTVYLFSKLNGVVFSEERFAQLAQAAREETGTNKQQEEEKSARESYEQIVARLMQEKSRMQEKYEDKIAGVQRKYSTDVEALKKQIRSLQQQIAHARQ